MLAPFWPPGGRLFRVFLEKKTQKVLRIAWNGEKIDQKIIQIFGHNPLQDTCTEKFPLVSMGAWAEGLACTDPGARAGASRNFLDDVLYYIFKIKFANLKFDDLDLVQFCDMNILDFQMN